MRILSLNSTKVWEGIDQQHYVKVELRKKPKDSKKERSNEEGRKQHGRKSMILDSRDLGCILNG